PQGASDDEDEDGLRFDDERVVQFGGEYYLRLAPGRSRSADPYARLARSRRRQAHIRRSQSHTRYLPESQSGLRQSRIQTNEEEPRTELPVYPRFRDVQHNFLLPYTPSYPVGSPPRPYLPYPGPTPIPAPHPSPYRGAGTWPSNRPVAGSPGL